MNRKAEIIQFAHDVINKLRNKAETELGIPKFFFAIDIHFNPNKSRSFAGHNGGRMFMEIAANVHLDSALRGTYMTFHEYARIRDDKEIGEMRKVSWKKALAGLIAHEFAHLLQMKVSMKKDLQLALIGKGVIQKNPNYNGTLGLDWKPHGKVWQSIYRFIRKDINEERGFDFSTEAAIISIIEKKVDDLVLKVFRFGERILKVITEIKGIILELVNGEWVETSYRSVEKMKYDLEWKLHEGVI